MNVEGRAPAIHYAKSGGLNIAFSVTGEGPDLVVAPGFISHLDIMWEEPSVVALLLAARDLPARHHLR